MSATTQEQAAINKAQADLNQRRADATKAAMARQHELSKQVQQRLLGVPMHGTNVGETALVVMAVLDIIGLSNDPAPAPEAAGQR